MSVRCCVLAVVALAVVTILCCYQEAIASAREARQPCAVATNGRTHATGIGPCPMLLPERPQARITIIVKVPPKPSANAISSTVLVAGLGVMGTLLAGAFTERLTRRREAKSQAHAWNALLFQRYEAAYRAFLATWAGGTNIDVLRTAFARLHRDAFVPPRLQTAYEATVKKMADAPSPAEAQEAATELQNTFATVVGDPAGFTTRGGSF
jgi:hypothetical protein